MKIDHVERLCNQANTVFISETLTGYSKFKYLPNWLNNKSRYLSSERNDYDNGITRNKWIYKRGSIVYVDFGINVGCELSGNHFAIVINNKDNKSNDLLTVIPISSKNKKNYLPVGKIIELESIKYFASQSDKIMDEFYTVGKCAVLKNEIDMPQLEQDNPELFHHIKLKEFETEEFIFNKAKKYNIETESELFFENHSNRLMKKADDYKKVFDNYKKYTKPSYAMMTNIQTVSKSRIRRLNQYDPSGKIKTSSEVMANIDEIIKKNLTK